MASGNAEETVRKSRINPDDPRFVRGITIGVAFAGLVAFAISFVSLMEVAAWLGLPAGMHWAVPAFIDTAILVYAGSVLIHKARGDKAWPSWVMLGLFTAISIVGNTAHALAHASAQAAPWHAGVGAAIAAMVPVAVFTATEQLARVAVEDPVSRRHELEALAEWNAQQAERERDQLEREGEAQRARQAAELEQEVHLTRLAEVQAARQGKIEAAKHAAALPTTRLHAVEESTPTTPGATAPTTGTNTTRTSRRGVSLDDVAAFVAERNADGLETMGRDVGEKFGFTDKSGRRKLQQLREQRPDLFEEGETDE